MTPFQGMTLTQNDKRLETVKKILFILLWTIIPIYMYGTNRDACWLNAETGAWEWFFFKDFAVHDSQRWKYASIKNGKKKITVTLQNGEETLQLEIRYRNDSTCTIAIGSEKAQTYRLWDSTRNILSYLPDGPTPPQPCNYQEDSVTQCGYLPDMKTTITNSSSTVSLS